MRSLFLVCLVAAFCNGEEAASWSCEILPAERQVTIDPVSKARVVFVTTRSSSDQGLYFHDRSWLSDETMMVFLSDRTGRSEPFGYLEASGKLVRLTPEGKSPLSSMTCSRKGNLIYGLRDGNIVAWAVQAERRDPPSVRIVERIIAPLPANGGLSSSLNENMDGAYLAFSCRDATDSTRFRLMAVQIENGRIVPVVSAGYPMSHVQFSWERPDLIMFARTYPEGDRVPVDQKSSEPAHCRLYNVDLSGKPPQALHFQAPGELVTHECWWTGGRFTFCGGYHPNESHVRIFDLKTKNVSIIGAGSWWPEATPAELGRRAWWHAAGSPDGRWVVADNFHGDVVVFDAKTTQEHALTTGHRTFGQGGVHPHPGWNPSSSRVVFTSNKHGHADVVIAYLPADWK